MTNDNVSNVRIVAVNYNFDGSTATFADRFFTAFPEKNIKSELAPSVVVSYMGDTCTDNTELLDDSSDGVYIFPVDTVNRHNDFADYNFWIRGSWVRVNLLRE
eukprot:gene4235-5216_t